MPNGVEVTEPIVSVVIAAYLRRGALRRAVQSVLDQDLPHTEYELVVVDSSPDDVNRSAVEDLRQRAKCSVRFFHKSHTWDRRCT
jgi:glycosyltransferase involved in cell wall biosynthesis